MGLSGIDISGWQAGINVGAVPGDFAIVKGTGGTSFTNPEYRTQADQTLASGKLLGVYHFARESSCPGSASAEARHFLDEFAPYKGKAIPVLDWEADALAQPVSWAREWLDIVARETGSTPWLYTGASYVSGTDCSEIAQYPLWMASYLYRYMDIDGYVDDPELTWGSGSWPRVTCYQYSSTCNLPGYGGSLDVNFFYGTRADWESYIKGGGGGTPQGDLQRVTNRGGSVFRLYNQANGDHMYTADENEYNALVGSGWKNEGIAFYAPIGTEPVFRLFNPNRGDHMWTASFDEAESLQAAGWLFEGVPFFASVGGKKVYRLYNPSDGDHFYTASDEERESLTGIGWKYEGVAFYV